MALERIVNKRFKEIDRDSDVQKNVVKYICNLIDSNYENFVSIFGNDIEKDFSYVLSDVQHGIDSEDDFDGFKKDYFETVLYDKAKAMLDDLDTERRLMGKDYWTVEPQKILGFAKYSKSQLHGDVVKRKLTAKGKKIIEEYRKVKFGVD